MEPSEFTSENCYALADFIEEKPKKGFSIFEWMSGDGGCGTVACVSGWCHLMYNGCLDPKRTQGTVERELTHNVGITTAEAESICWECGYIARDEEPTQANAVKRLRMLGDEYHVKEANQRKAYWKLNEKLKLVEA